jgi:tripartite-type tricarboxylate transporter receptor subunit TctC
VDNNKNRSAIGMKGSGMRAKRSLAVIAFVLACPALCWSQQYPTRVIRLVVPSSPGGGSDILGRIIAQKLGESLGQQVVIDNRPGASGVIGMDIVAKAPPDGYTLVLTQASLAINPSMFKKLPYDSMRDFAPISVLMVAPFVLSVHPSVPAKTVKELIALAKAKPGRLVIGSAGLGTSPHLAGELLKLMAGVDMPQVLFKGSGPGLISLLSGEISVMFPSSVSVIAYFKAAKLRALGVTSLNRVQALPEVPSIAEAALPGYEAMQWYGVLARSGTPLPIIDRLNQEMNRLMRTPEMKERLTAEGAEASSNTPEEFATLIQKDTEKWAKVIKEAGIKPE